MLPKSQFLKYDPLHMQSSAAVMITVTMISMVASALYMAGSKAMSHPTTPGQALKPSSFVPAP